MDPLEINATYRRQQLLDEARDEAWRRSLRAARLTRTAPRMSGILGGVARVIARVRDSRRAPAPRNASI